MRLSQLRSRYHDQNLSSEEEAFDENNVLRDGKSTRVPMFLMDSKTVVSIDSAQRDADTQKQDAIKRHNAWLKDAWKMKKDKFAGGHGHSKPDPDEEEEEHCTNCANCTNQGKLIPRYSIHHTSAHTR
jgi:hypothetical protein